MDSGICSVCGKELDYDSEIWGCDRCGKEHHPECAGYSEEGGCECPHDYEVAI